MESEEIFAMLVRLGVRRVTELLKVYCVKSTAGEQTNSTHQCVALRSACRAGRQLANDAIENLTVSYAWKSAVSLGSCYVVPCLAPGFAAH